MKVGEDSPLVLYEFLDVDVDYLVYEPMTCPYINEIRDRYAHFIRPALHSNDCSLSSRQMIPIELVTG